MPAPPASEQRRFIRHPVDIPIEVQVAERADARAFNVSHGGLALRLATELRAGNLVTLRIAIVDPVFETSARVAWCSACDRGFELGVEFLGADDAFRARMVEQVCSIESYRKTVSRTEGRSLTPEEAALEWIGRFASDFPEGGRADPR